MPLRVDTLIIKKKHRCVIRNEIGSVFQTYNLIEYKSPNDTLNYNTFLKGIAYAYLYKSQEVHVDDIQLSDMSLTFIRKRKPLKLFRRLEKEKFCIEQFSQGIYYINNNNSMAIQIIVSKELDSNNHIWLNSLTDKLNQEQAENLLSLTGSLTALDDKNYADSVWEIVTTQNRKLFMKMREDEEMCKAMAEIFKPEIDAAFNNGFSNGYDAACIRIVSAKLKNGKSVEEIADNLELEVDEINRLIERIETTA